MSALAPARSRRTLTAVGRTLVQVLVSRSGTHSTLVVFLVAEVVLFSQLQTAFLSPANLLNAGRATAILAIISVGATFGLISGALDISVGSVIALAGTVATQLAVRGQPASVAVLAALGVGILAGLINGFVVVKLRVNPIVATLGMLGIARGLALLPSGGSGVVQANAPMDRSFSVMQVAVMGIPLPLIVASAIVVVGYFVLSHTRFGVYAYAVGGNPGAARAAAIPVDRLRVAYLTLSGACAGFAGWVLASMLGGAAGNVALGYELTAVTAVILGGVGLAGGTGSMLGTALGVLILGSMVNGLNLAGIPTYYQLVAQGTLLILAVGLDAVRSGGYR